MFRHADSTEVRSLTGVFVGLGVAVAVVLTAAKVAPLLVLQDFSIYWRATTEWLAGGNPYDLPDHRQYVSGVVGEVDLKETMLKVWSPPTFLFAMLPFSLSSLELGKVLYLCLAILTTWGWLILTYRSVCDVFSLKGVGAAIAGASITTLIFPWSPTVDMLRWGGMSVLSSLAFLIIVYSPTLSTATWTAVFMLFSLKPHPATLAVIALLVLASPKERQQMLGGAAFALLLVLTPIFFQSSLIQLYTSVPVNVVNDYRVYTQTLSGTLIRLDFTPPIATLVSLGYWAIVLVSIKQDSGVFANHNLKLAVILLITPLSIFLAPYAWTHDYVLCGGFLWAIFIVCPKRRSAQSLVVALAISSNIIFLGEMEFIPCPRVLLENLTLLWALASLALLYWFRFYIYPGASKDGAVFYTSPHGKEANTESRKTH